MRWVANLVTCSEKPPGENRNTAGGGSPRASSNANRSSASACSCSCGGGGVDNSRRPSERAGRRASDGSSAPAPAPAPGPTEAKRRRLAAAVESAMGGRSHHSLRGGPLGATPMVQIHSSPRPPSPPSPSPANLNINQALPGLDHNINIAAALGVDKQLMRKALQDYRNSVIPDDAGNMPIHNAVLDGNLIQVRRQCIIFRARRESVDIYNSEKKTPLHLAVLCENEKIIDELLTFRADPGLADKRGNTALHLAVDHTDSNVALKAVLRHTQRYSVVLDQTNDEGYSPLHLCAMQNREAHAVLLLERGADVNQCDRKSGRTALFHAVECNYQELSSKLLCFGASTTVPNFAGHMPLNACENSIALLPDVATGHFGLPESAEGDSKGNKSRKQQPEPGCDEDVEMLEESDPLETSPLDKLYSSLQIGR